MKRLAFALVAVAVVAVAAAPQAQEGAVIEMLSFVGNTDDFGKLPPQTPQKNEFTFLRMLYNGQIQYGFSPYAKNWYTDWPEGDANLVKIYRRLVRTDIAPESRVLPILHADLSKYPLIYTGEAGQMVLNVDEAKRMRKYLERGGFWMLDDFWGSVEWASFEREMRSVFPDREIVDIPLDHPIFHCVFDIPALVQVPVVQSGYMVSIDPNYPTSEQDGYVPYAKGIFGDDGRLLVFINHNTDMMDGSEWSNDPRYPERFSSYAFKMFVNAHIYALTH